MSEPAPPSPKILLAASGGGHIRQLLDLRPFWEKLDYVLATENTALGRTIAAEHRTHFIPHFAAGQARLGMPFKMLCRALKSLFVCARIIWLERPDIVLTTGAGAVIFLVVFGRLSGARIIIIDSFARFRAPSLFARLAGPLAHTRIAQAPEVAKAWGTDLCFDPFRIVETPRPAKAPLVLCTVGATLPFDRLVGMVAEAHRGGLIPEQLIIQTGEGGASPEGLNVVEALSFDEMLDIIGSAEIVICHGGTGSLITALRQGCRVIAVPRRFDLGEHYDDHQVEVSRALAARGLIMVAEGEDDLPAALEAARQLEPRVATTDPSALIAYLEGVAGHWAPPR